jgi:hypothetical protein
VIGPRFIRYNRGGLRSRLLLLRKFL